MSKKDPATQRAIENYEKLKLKIKEKLTSNPKLWDHFKERISMYGDYEDIIWKDIITNLMMVYNWRVPPSLSSNDGLIALFESHFITNIFTFYEFVLGVKIKPAEKKTQNTEEKNKKPTFLEMLADIDKDNIN